MDPIGAERCSTVKPTKEEVMRRFILGSILGAALAVVPAAAAGGWATAGVSPPPPGTGAGDTWNAQVTLLQHGQTPLVGVKPSVNIRNEAGTVIRFPARPTGKPGVYTAKVKFPAGGTWRYSVDDGFSQTHTFGAVTIAGGAGDVGGSTFPVVPAIAGTALALVLAGVLFLLIRRQRRAEPVPA
jgi:hypothetical protein